MCLGRRNGNVSEMGMKITVEIELTDREAEQLSKELEFRCYDKDKWLKNQFAMRLRYVLNAWQRERDKSTNCPLPCRV
jgi:hypothetical protein